MPLLEVTDQPSESDLSIIGDGISAYNDEDIGPSPRKSLAVLIRDENGRIIGGLSGRTGWGWLFIQYLFVPEHLRGQGLAGKLLTRAEEEARARGCHGAWIDTFNPQALRAYRRQGYEIFGELPDYPPGRTRSFLRKRL
ncbi:MULTISPECIES: GNAT family N-acetyltransferase [unclassified Sinorhizobium]|uniref:GNAT family N-acetyltransferase n=1 Tax=unclassified Sinorhizobium TaxID=2613772 RepID=UPI0035269F2E